MYYKIMLSVKMHSQHLLKKVFSFLPFLLCFQAGVIMGEVNCIWPDIRRQVDDPFLTPEENKELQRRIRVHIVTVCEQIFHHYVEKAKGTSN